MGINCYVVVSSLLCLLSSLHSHLDPPSPCNRAPHLHIVFVLLYVLCVSLCRCSFGCVRHSIFYVCVTCCDLDVTISLSETAREKARGNNNDLSHVPSKRKEEIKPGTSGCVSFVVPYFQPATSTDHLHPHTSPHTDPFHTPLRLTCPGWLGGVGRAVGEVVQKLLGVPSPRHAVLLF